MGTAKRFDVAVSMALEKLISSFDLNGNALNLDLRIREAPDGSMTAEFLSEAGKPVLDVKSLTVGYLEPGRPKASMAVPKPTAENSNLAIDRFGYVSTPGRPRASGWVKFRTGGVVRNATELCYSIVTYGVGGQQLDVVDITKEKLQFDRDAAGQRLNKEFIAYGKPVAIPDYFLDEKMSVKRPAEPHVMLLCEKGKVTYAKKSVV
jgi:hypothetical protein